MSEFRKTSPNDIYFLTLTIEGWVDLFTRLKYIDILVKNFTYCQEKEGLEIFSYVIMSNHVHLIASRKDADLTELIGRFKSFTSKKLLEALETNSDESRKEWLLYLFRHFAKHIKQDSKHHVWHYSNHPIQLFTEEVFKQKINYIHNNPVRAGLVVDQSHWLYSSASPNSPLKTLPWN